MSDAGPDAGHVSTCCFGTGKLGTIRDVDPLEIWNGETAVALRGRGRGRVGKAPEAP